MGIIEFERVLIVHLVMIKCEIIAQTLIGSSPYQVAIKMCVFLLRFRCVQSVHTLLIFTL